MKYVLTGKSCTFLSNLTKILSFLSMSMCIKWKVKDCISKGSSAVLAVKVIAAISKLLVIKFLWIGSFRKVINRMLLLIKLRIKLINLISVLSIIKVPISLAMKLSDSIVPVHA